MLCSVYIISAPCLSVRVVLCARDDELLLIIFNNFEAHTKTHKTLPYHTPKERTEKGFEIISFRFKK